MDQERSFQRRGKQVSLRELTDLFAVRQDSAAVLESARPFTAESADARSPARAVVAGEALSSLTREVPAPQLQAFEAAGWTFVPREQAEVLLQEVPKARVYIRPGGRLALGTDTLTVKFQKDLTEEEANQRLAPHGCRVLERLSFAPGFFRVQVTEPSQTDAIEVANQLARTEGYEIAEPELIEMMGGR